MPGSISLSLEREPDYFADAGLPGAEKQTIVARQGGRMVCVGSSTIRQRYVNGAPRRVGYLGGLRLDASVAGRFDILRRGYEFFHELQAGNRAAFYFTSIAADNQRARKLLERGLPGMPRYEFIGEFVTLLLRTERWSPTRHVFDDQPNRAGSETSGPMLADLLNTHNQRHQLATHWTAEQLKSLAPLGLCTNEFRVRGQACAALWDQRAFKQTVIRGYAPWLSLTRRALNFVASVTGNPRLPAVGNTLSSAFVSPLAAPTDDKNGLREVISELQSAAAHRRIELLSLGFAANDPRLATMRENFRCREYRSRLYVVRWPDCGGAASELDGRIPSPEAALL